MKKIIQSIAYILITMTVFAFSGTSASAAEQANVSGTTLQLNGLGIQTQLRNEWFLNGLYLASKTTDAEEAVSSPGAKRMELRVLADDLSGRRLKRFWIERIKSNNEASNVLANAKAVRDFAKLMDKNFVRGDIITVDLIPSEATVVSINGSEVGRMDSAVFPLILRTWVGERPPSSEFKDDILGETSDVERSELLVRFNATEPTAARIAMFDEVAIEAKKEAEREEREAEEEKKRAEEAKKEAEEQRKLEEKRKLAEQKKAEVEAKENAAEVAEAERLRKELEEAKQELAAQKKAAAEAAAKGPTAAELAQIRAQYSNDVGAHYVPYFEYPQRDILRRYGKSTFMRPQKGKTHGDVSIKIELDRDGQLVGGELVESSGEKILDDAVMNALFDSVPFPSMPEDLPGETFKTTVSISIPAPQL